MPGFATRGTRIFYHDLPGSRPPLLFVHGLGCSSSCDYPRVAASPRVVEHRRLLIDLPGFGFSDKTPDHDYSLENQVRALRELVLHLDLSELTLFGHSMGGAVVVSLAAQLGSRVRSLVVAEGNLDPGGGPTSLRVAGSELDDYVSVGHRRLVDESRQAGNHLWASTLEVSAPQAVHQGAVDLVRGGNPTWRDLLYGLPCRRTYLFGEQNFAPAAAEVLEAQGVAVGIVPSAGHNMAHDNPEGLAHCIALAMAGDQSTGPGPGLRDAAPSDAPRLAEIQVFGWRTAYRGLLSDEYLFRKMSVTRRVEAFQRALGSGEEETLVWDEGGLVGAFLTLGPSRDPGSTAFEVWGLYVDPGFQRRGVGARLLREAEAVAAARGFTEVTLWVLRGSFGSVAFYRAQGYQPDGAVQFVDFLDAEVVRMAKGLSKRD